MSVKLLHSQPPTFHPSEDSASPEASELTLNPKCTAIIATIDRMSTGIGRTQRAILGELKKLPIEAIPEGIPVVELAERLGCSDRQIRRAVHSLQERGRVTLVKEPRPGRQGQSLMVWHPQTLEGWLNFTDPLRIQAHSRLDSPSALGVSDRAVAGSADRPAAAYALPGCPRSARTYAWDDGRPESSRARGRR